MFRTGFNQVLTGNGQSRLYQAVRASSLPGFVTSGIQTIESILDPVISLDADLNADLDAFLFADLVISGATGDLVATHVGTGRQLMWTGLDLTAAHDVDLALDLLGDWDISVENIALTSLLETSYRLRPSAGFDFAFRLFSAIEGGFGFGLDRSQDYDFRIFDADMALDFGQARSALGRVSVVEERLPPIPLPAGVILMGAALGNLALLRRRG